MGDHDTPVVGVGVLGGLDGLGQGTDLVNLQQKSVARLELDGLLDAEGVGDSQVITDNLEVGGLVEVAPGLPVVLSEGVLDGDNGVLGSQGLVEIGQLLVGEPLGGVGVGVLEVQVVLLGVGLVELAGGNIHGDGDLASVAGLLDGLGDEVKSLLGSLNIGSDTTLVTNVTSGLAVLLLGQSLQLLVDLSTLTETLGERLGSAVNSVSFHFHFHSRVGSPALSGKNLLRDNHELLEGQTATGVGATVQDVLEGNGEDVGLLGTGKVGNVDVERDTLLGGGSLGNGQGDTKDGVGTKVTLVGSAIELVQELINLSLVLDVNVLLDESGANGLVDVLDGLEDTYSSENRSVTCSVGQIECGKNNWESSYPCHPTWPCHRHGAQQPRVDLEVVSSIDFSSGVAAGHCHSSVINYIPVEAPDGTMARCRPVSVTTSTSTVGLPRESYTERA